MSERGSDLQRYLIGALLLVALYLTMSWLQGRFDSSDHDKATQIVQRYVPPEGGTPLVDALLKRHPEASASDISWGSELQSSCLGHVRVSANVPSGKGYETYAFDVALTGPSVHPTDEVTLEILRSLTTATTTTSDRSAAGTATAARDHSPTP